LAKYITLDKNKTVDCTGPFTPKDPLSDNMFYMEYGGSSVEKDLKDNTNKIYISDFFIPGGPCNWNIY